MEYDMKKSSDSRMAGSARSGIRSVCIPLKRGEIETKSLITTGESVRKLLYENFLCPCGKIDLIEEKEEKRQIHKLSINSEKCGL